MITKMAQIKLSLPMNIKKFAKSKANKYGLTLAGYIRYLLISEMRVKQYPKYELTARSKRNLEEAMKNFDKSVVIDNVDKFFDKL
ncbi:hypothetical protein KBB48_00295 [Candidatus Shapirobacteria bacterium]|nr:hypothetical protein [Candidatus Shapirobacteria bacterium]